MITDVTRDDESRKSFVINGINSVTHHTQDVEPRQDWLSQVHLCTCHAPHTGCQTETGSAQSGPPVYMSRTTHRMSNRDRIGSVRSTCVHVTQHTQDVEPRQDRLSLVHLCTCHASHTGCPTETGSAQSGPPAYM